MTLNLDPVYLTFIAALAFSLVLLFMLIGYVWPRRSTPGAIPLILISVSLIFWVAGYLLEYFSPSLETKLFTWNISYIGMVTLPVLSVIFASYFTNKTGWLTSSRIILLLIIPAITLILQWTKPFHSLMYYDIQLITDNQFLVVSKQYGIWFWIDWLYNYILVITSMVMLIYRLFRPPQLYMDQAIYLITGVVVPVIANIIYVLHLSPGPHVDWTPCAFTVTALALTLAITRHHFLDIVPVARDSVIEMLSEGFIVLDDNEHIIDLNKGMLLIAGKDCKDLMGKPLPDIILNQLNREYQYAANNECKTEISLKNRDKLAYYSVHSCPLHKSSLRNYGRIMVFHDITERKIIEETIRHTAYYDPLTGLANRTLFSDRAGMALEECKRHSRKMAILIIDFDKFKMVNDTYGHSTGDLVLKGLSKRISCAVRKVDTVSRLGGDEFLVLMPEIAGEEITTSVARRIIDLVSSPFIFDGHDVSVTISVGITVYPDDATDVDTLIKFADIAMYKAKQNGRNCCCRYISNNGKNTISKN